MAQRKKVAVRKRIAFITSVLTLSTIAFAHPASATVFNPPVETSTTAAIDTPLPPPAPAPKKAHLDNRKKKTKRKHGKPKEVPFIFTDFFKPYTVTTSVPTTTTTSTSTTTTAPPPPPTTTTVAPAPVPTTAPTAPPAPAPAPVASGPLTPGEVAAWEAVNHCEEGPGTTGWATAGYKYEGGLGFLYATWDQYNVYGYPHYAYDASPYEQMVVAQNVVNHIAGGEVPYASPNCYGYRGW